MFLGTKQYSIPALRNVTGLGRQMSNMIFKKRDKQQNKTKTKTRTESSETSIDSWLWVSTCVGVRGIQSKELVLSEFAHFP